MSEGALFLIPVYLSQSNDSSFVSPLIIGVLQQIDSFLVENARTARRFISSLKAGVSIESLMLETLDKKASRDDMYALFEPLRNGKDMGLMSEAGIPCLADPGNIAVSYAHDMGIRIIPLPGTSSIQMALIASGFNGQEFTFCGYLPIDKQARIKKIKELEKASSEGCTQLFMETPYRNHQLLEDILQNCGSDTLLGIASDISGIHEYIRTQSICKWKKTDIQIHKIPTIFSFGQFP